MIARIKISHKQWKVFFNLSFALTFLIACCLSLPLIKHGFVLETDLQSLFPKDKQDLLINKINDRLYSELGNKLLVAVQATDTEQMQTAADIVAGAIAKNPQIKINVPDAQMTLIAQQRKLLQQYHYHLLTPAQQQLIQNNQQHELLTQAQAALFGFSLGGDALSPLQDPLNLIPAYIQQLQPAIKGELINDRLVIATENEQLILFALDLQGESFNLDVQEQMNSWLKDVRYQLSNNPKSQNTQLLISGAVFHAAEASANAQREMTIIGSGSSLGVLLLFILAFRRIKPLVLSLASVFYGCLLALIINHYLFGKIHLMTLVFGASLIGVAVDYSLHYLCKYQELSRLIPSAKNRGEQVMEKLLPALSLSLIASALGYSSLLPTPLPGLQQIALFSVTGLCGSWLFLVVMYPLLVRQELPEPSHIIDRCASTTWLFWERMRGLPQLSIFFGLTLLIILGIFGANLSSDVRTLYKPSEHLLISEQRLHKALQGVSPNQYFMLRAESAEALLQTEERFRREHLDDLVTTGKLSGYVATSSIVPSQQQQSVNYKLMQQLYNTNGIVAQFMQSAGFDEQTIKQAHDNFSTAPQKPLNIDQWLAVARPDQQLLWLGQFNDSYVSIIGLRGIIDLNALSTAADNNSIIWVDRVAGMSHLLRQLMNSSALLLFLAYLAILPLLWIYFRSKKALLLICVPLMSTITTLSLLSISGEAINLFHLFGCYLILGLGMDYGIFSYTQGIRDKVTQRAIWLSAVSSSLSFGLLALSSTPMVKAFGITLFIGCFFNLLYAPLAGHLNNTHRATGTTP